MFKFLFEITNKLSSITIQNAIMNGKRMLKAAIIASCLHKMFSEKEIPLELLNKLLNLFRLLPDVEKETCEDWDYFKTSIPESLKATASEAMYRFINELSGRESLSYSSWLFATPVAHFLSGASEPFQSIELDDREIQWTDEDINLTDIRRKTQHHNAVLYVMHGLIIMVKAMFSHWFH